MAAVGEREAAAEADRCGGMVEAGMRSAMVWDGSASAAAMTNVCDAEADANDGGFGGCGEASVHNMASDQSTHVVCYTCTMPDHGQV